MMEENVNKIIEKLSSPLIRDILLIIKENQPVTVYAIYKIIRKSNNTVDKSYLYKIMSDLESLRVLSSEKVRRGNKIITFYSLSDNVRISSSNYFYFKGYGIELKIKRS